MSCFSQTVLLPGTALPWDISLPLYRSGFLRSRFPCLWYYDCATTAYHPSRSLIFLYSRYWSGLLLFRFPLSTLRILSIAPPRARGLPGAFVTRLVRRRPLPPEMMSPHTFPYDLLYICPTLRPRPRWSNSHNARPRSLPLKEK